MRLIDADELLKGKQDHEMISTHVIWNAPTIEPCEDAVSREALIKKFWKVLYDYEDETEKQFIEHEELDVGDWIDHRYFVQTIHGLLLNEVVDAPSVAPSRPSGENLRKEYSSLFECSVCGASCDDTLSWSCDINYCPNCGAKMKGADDED